MHFVTLRALRKNLMKKDMVLKTLEKVKWNIKNCLISTKSGKV